MTTPHRLGGTLVLAALLLLTSPPAPQAAGIPVEDAAAFGRLVAQLTQMGQIYTRQDEELTQALRLVQSLTRASTYGTSLDTAALIALRRALPRQMQDLNRLNSLASTPNLARSITLFGTLSDRYGLNEPEAYEPADPDAPYAQAWRADRDAQLGAAVSAGVVYDGLEEREEFYETAMDELDTREDLKESVDLLARVTAENGRLLMDLIRVQTANAQAAAAADLNKKTHAAKMRRIGAYEDNFTP